MMERRKLTYDISQLREYINWPYFYHAWQLKDSRQQEKIKLEAMKALDDMPTHSLHLPMPMATATTYCLTG